MQRALAWLSVAYPAAVAVFAAGVAWFALARHFVIYNYDDWKVLDFLFSRPFGEWLLTPQNGHLMPTTLYLFHLDYRYFEGQTRLLIVSSLLFAAGAVAGLYAAQRAGREPLTSASRVVFAFMAFTYLWAASLHSFLWGLAAVNVLTSMLAILALALLVDAWARRSRGEGGWPSRVVLAGFAALAATFSFGTGFATWIALLVVAIAARSSWRISAGLGAAGAFALAVYLAGISEMPSRLAPGLLLRRPLGLLEYTASFVGSAVGRVAQGIGGLTDDAVYQWSVWAGGVGMLGAAAFGLWLLSRPSRATPHGLFALGLMTFPCVAGGVAALARLDLSPLQGIWIRYAIWSALFWMGAVGALGSLPALSRGVGALAAALTTGLPLLSLLMLPALGDQLEAHRARERVLERGSLALILGVESDPHVRPMSPFLAAERLYRVADRLERDQRGFFTDARAALAGTRLLEERSASEADRCRGRMRRPVPLSGRAEPAASVLGHLKVKQGEPQPTLVAITDRSGTVRGLGEPLSRESAGDGSLPWEGLIAGFDASESYRAYAILDDDSACPLGAR